MDIPNDILNLIYNFIPITEIQKSALICKSFHNNFKRQYNACNIIQKYYKKYRIPKNYLNKNSNNKYNHYIELNYDDWNNKMLYRYYLLHYPISLIYLYPKSVLNIYSRTDGVIDRWNKINIWIKDNNDMKTIPIPNNRKTVALGEIDIFLRDKVGILLTKRIAIKTVKYGVNFLTSIPKLKFVNS